MIQRLFVSLVLIAAAVSLGGGWSHVGKAAATNNYKIKCENKSITLVDGTEPEHVTLCPGYTVTWSFPGQSFDVDFSQDGFPSQSGNTHFPGPTGTATSDSTIETGKTERYRYTITVSKKGEKAASIRPAHVIVLGGGGK